MTRRAAIILAGGKSKRFQNEQEMWQDKASVELFGKPLLVHAVKNVRDVVDDIVVSVNNEERKVHYAEILEKQGITNVKLLIDKKMDCLGGPLVAILTGLESVEADYCLTLPSDMPLVQPKVIEYLFAVEKDPCVVVPIWPNGRLETLIMVLEKNSSLKIAETLCKLGRPRSDDIIRGASKIVFVSIVGELAKIDPELKTFVNINSREDLSKLQPRRAQGDATENLHITRGTLPTRELPLLREASILRRESKFWEALTIFSSCAHNLEDKNAFFWAALSRENEGKCFLSLSQQESNAEFAAEQASKAINTFLKAAANYGLEADMHEKDQCAFLAERATSDKTWCESRANETKIQMQS
jgi:molybdopterin-guanine dinucleotide biosynthesis protein A